MIIKRLVFALLPLVIAACTTPEQQQAAAEQAIRLQKIDDNYIPVTYVSISCVGHADTAVTGYFVQDLVSTRKYGGGGCGGIAAVGYPLPKQWQPGLKVTVGWKLDGQPWRETTTSIMRYEKTGTMYVHVFNNNQVRVVSAPIHGPGNPRHPIDQNAKIPPSEEQ